MKNVLLNILPTFLNKKKAYTSIKELPISKWWAICEGNFTKLIIKGSFTNHELYSIYLNLLQEYYDNFGTTEEHKQFINARYQYAIKLAEHLQEQNGTSLMFLAMAKEDLKDVTPKKESESVKLQELIVKIEKNYGFPLNEDTLSTYKFYSYLKNG